MADLGLPARLFADREEPVGDRVNQYFKLHTIKAVLKALQPTELELIRPCFGKLLDVYSKPVFSGKLAHFLLTRQLNVVKRHEIWVVFAGKPIRFSLREYGLVTGLNCLPLPPLDRSLLRAPPGVTPYWFTLFGGEESITGEILLSKLRRPRSLTSDQRVKYACLLLVDGLLARRSYHMKIPKSHVEMIRNLDTFLAYPWGRYTFDMTMRCIKSRSLDQLAQQTVAIQGFIHALVLVFVEAVPSVVSAVGDCTDPESGDDDVFPVISLNLDTVWDLDKEDKVDVIPIIPSEDGLPGLEDCSWNDEVGDPAVDFMLQQIADGVKFSRGMFVGGIRGVDVQVEPPPRVVKNGKRKTRAKVSDFPSSRGESSRTKKTKVRTSGRSRSSPSDSPGISLDSISAQIKAGLKEGQCDVYASVCVELKDMELRLERSMKENICSAVSAAIDSRVLVGNVLREVGEEFGVSAPYQPAQGFTPARSQPQAKLNSNPLHQSTVGFSNGNAVANPTDVPHSSTRAVEGAGTTQSSGESSRSHDGGDVMPDLNGDGGADQEVEAMSAKFKKLMVTLIPTMKFALGDGLVLNDSELLKIPTSIPPDSPQVMDACVSVVRESLFQNTDPATDSRADLLPCKFFGSLAALYGKFKKFKRKESFEFDESVLAVVSARFEATRRLWLANVDSVLSPFNIDKNRWIAVHIDLPSHTLTVFDPTAAVRRGSRLKPELQFICEMFPYLVRKVGANKLMQNFPIQPLTFARNTHVAQASDVANSGMMSLLFLEAHATGGISKVYMVQESGMRERAEQLAVAMYEHCFGDL